MMPRVVFLAMLCSLYCVSEVSAQGWIFPQKAVYLEVNDTIRLQCTLNMHSLKARGMNSSYLMFYTQSDIPVPREQVKIINSTTIEFTVDHAQPSANAYTCKLNDTWGIAIRTVYVGHKPQEVKDFKCRAPRWKDQMVCTFTREVNPVTVNYTLEFHFYPATQSLACALKDKEETNMKECVIENGYRLMNEYYYFTLTAKNELGSLSQDFAINHFDVVIPYMDDNCSVEAISSNSAVLKWKKWYKYTLFNRDFISEVKLLSIYDDNVWQNVNNEGLELHNMEYVLPLRDLKYAATRYDVRIRMRTNSSEQGDDMWSNYTSCLFTTLPRRPDMPPDVAVGSFEHSNEKRLFVYWRELDKWQYNAASGFYYEVQMHRQDGTIRTWNETIGMIAEELSPDMDYSFRIRSANTEGTSENSSVVFVPSQRHRLAKPTIEKLLSDSGEFTLSWKPPSRDASSITSYTVFWCKTNSNSPNDCKGSINFTTVPSNQTTFVLGNGGVALNFAVSANADQHSSGMVWAACTATHKTDIGKLKPILITETASSSIHLQWNTECGDVVHTGYMIFYCNINEPRMQDCKEPELSINVTNKNQHSYLLENLKSYATYKIEIAMYSETHIGPRSEPAFNTTRESAPSQPRNLTVQNITKNSVTLHWQPPLQINGGTMSYEILYNGQSHKHNLEGPYNREVEKTLDNLEPFTDYNITVRAHTVADSPVSNVVHVRTLLGEPQTIDQPSTNSTSSSQLTIGWNPPSKPAGCTEFYELRITSKGYVTYQQRRPGCQLRQAICQTQDSFKYEFSVRAVNVDIVGEEGVAFTNLSCEARWEVIQMRWPALKHYVAYDECGTDASGTYHHGNGFAEGDMPPHDVRLLYGAWSVPLAHWCNVSGKSGMVLPLVILGSFILVFVLMSYSVVKVKHVLKVQVIIPDGLNDLTGPSKPSFNVVSAGGLIFAEHGTISNCTKDDGYAKEQNQCLLQSSSSSGGSIGDLSRERSSPDFCSNSACCEEDNTSFYDQEAERQDEDLDHRFGDDASDTIDSNHLDELQSQSHSSPNGGAMMDRSFGNVNKGCTSGTPPALLMMMEGAGGTQSNPTPMPVTSGYVPAPAVNPIKQPINSSGYLQIGALANVAMMAPSDSMQKTFNAKMSATPISGYVTHKQLSDYGQHLQ
ncbi:cytokine receptor-like [Anopheles coustani]|uniref:cytokine receptor-like n=1 Tax=Anopheles coustani TaxID=139045 RepID=UPI00265AF4FF|nr:cytokine receptor-like [Anopheles coustani]